MAQCTQFFFRSASETQFGALKCIRRGACINTCPVYQPAGGLSYGATYSGPIGVILDPGVDLEKYRELPLHSSLCGSCSQVCPVKIDIAPQIYKWRRAVAEKGLLKLSKKVSVNAIGGRLTRGIVVARKPNQLRKRCCRMYRDS
jgi:L-lactate dehydrogenase complex protein LldF